MMDRLISPETGREYIKQLHLTVLGAGEHSRRALKELSAIATGGHTLAQELVTRIDEAVQAGELVLPMSVEKPSGIADALFIATHPILSLKAKVRQVGVAIERQSPPPGSSIEEFPLLSLAEAARIFQAVGSCGGGVPKEAWPAADQTRMARGERPLGHPEHPNV